MSEERQYGHMAIDVPDIDYDITLRFPTGKEIEIQTRPSNATETSRGSLDIILPTDQAVTCWEGDDMQPAPAYDWPMDHVRIAKQLVLDLP